MMAFLRLLFWIVRWTVILGLIVFGIHFWLTTKAYLFSADSISSIVHKHNDGRKGGDYDVRKAFHKIHQDLSKKYPGHILPAKDLQWVFMNAGGWMGAMCLLHASITEYVLFFGTAIDTSGHSGRYWANITDIVLTGEFKQWQEGEIDVHIYKSGDAVHHSWGEVTAVNFKAGTWMVEYGRGFIPSTLSFALADTLFSTTDFITLINICKIYGKALMMEASYYISHITG